MQVVDAASEHIEQFLRKPIRQDDIDEWFTATGGRSVPEALREVLTPDSMTTCRALLNDDNECICLWGVTPGAFGEGVVWLIASTEAEQHGRHIHRYWPREIALMHMKHSLLTAIAYGNNKMHLSWLEAIGFERLSVDYYGPAQLPFITFARRMPCVPH